MIFNSTYFEKSIKKSRSLGQVQLERNDTINIDHKHKCDLYLVKKGSVKVLCKTEDDYRLVDFGYENVFITSIAIFKTTKSTDIIIQAIKKAELLVISRKEFLEHIEFSSEGALELKKILINYINSKKERELDLLNPCLFERYRNLLKRDPKIFQKIPNKDIAKYLNMTPETFSKIKKAGNNSIDI